MDINKVIGDAVDKVSLKTANGMVDLNDAYHVFMVQEELKRHIPDDIVEGLFDKKIISSKSNNKNRGRRRRTKKEKGEEEEEEKKKRIELPTPSSSLFFLCGK